MPLGLSGTRIGVGSAPTELLLDLGGLLQPARLPPLALARVAEPAALPAAKVEPVGIELCDPATAAGAAELEPLPSGAAPTLGEHDTLLDVLRVLQRPPGAVLQLGLEAARH